MALRDTLGRFAPTFDPSDVVGPPKDVSIEDVINKYSSFTIAESSCVARVDYNFEEGSMIVAFQQRGTYKYFDVPFDEFMNFQGASSRGTYFNLYIRDQFNYQRI